MKQEQLMLGQFLDNMPVCAIKSIRLSINVTSLPIQPRRRGLTSNLRSSAIHIILVICQYIMWIIWLGWGWWRIFKVVVVEVVEVVVCIVYIDLIVTFVAFIVVLHWVERSKSVL